MVDMHAGAFRLALAEIDGARPVIERSGVCHRIDRLLNGNEPDIVEILAQWPHWQPLLDATFAQADRDAAIDPGKLRYLPPISRPPKLVCIGTNYRDHLREMNVTDIPQYPYAFLRPLTCLAAHGDDIPLPAWPKLIDWEAELGVIIAKGGRDLKGAAARAAIGGYTVINDLSARDWIVDRPWVGIDWVMQKAWDKFQPTGPWIVPAAFVMNPQNLAIELTVNGILRQKSNTGEMIFGVQEIVEHLSRIMTLEPGDVIATGTPAGVGFGQRPPLSLTGGDIVRVTIEGLGTLENRIV